MRAEAVICRGIDLPGNQRRLPLGPATTVRHQDLPLFATGVAANIPISQYSHRMDAMIARGQGDLDHSGVAPFYAELSGLE